LLYGFTPYEPVTILAAILILSVVAAAAGWIPLSRATRIDPARVLREA
jgi:ABC-type antimicrobial peptide transport system permease subunit